MYDCSRNVQDHTGHGEAYFKNTAGLQLLVIIAQTAAATNGTPVSPALEVRKQRPDLRRRMFYE
jgi:hypothetical protein